ncbi:MAG TPA: SRPBCC family protein [Candidatus Binatia bacterium]|nr:SRPBCC family protein [Candidatus Binatia bacterium]
MEQAMETGSGTASLGSGSDPETMRTPRSGDGSRANGSGATAGQGGMEERLARALGWLSVGLGALEAAAPRGLARLIGAPERPGLIRTMGLRELASGVGILRGNRPTGWVWSRVAGDAIDLALLGAAFRSPWSRPGRIAAAAAAVTGVTILDVLCGRELARQDGTAEEAAAGAISVERSLLVSRPPEEVYRFWRDFEKLPTFMRHLRSVQVMDGTRSHWVATGPAGTSVEWDAEIVEDVPNQLIAWRSVGGSDVANSGRVRFERAPGKRGTMVRVEIEYRPLGGAVGSAVAKVFGEEPTQQVTEDLRRFRQVIETGETATAAGPSGPGARSLRSRA